MNRVAIVGSREFEFSPAPETTDIFIRRIVESLVERGPLTIYSGGARGVDRWVAEACDGLGFHRCPGDAFVEAEYAGPPYHFVEYLAQWRDAEGRLDKGAGFRRNRRVVAEADLIIALFADGPSTPGTRNVVKVAKAQGKPVHYYHEGDWGKM